MQIMGASGINWRNVPHEEIVRQINGGAGVAGVSDLPGGYRQIAEALRQADLDLRAALAAAGASWEGVASDQMHTASTPLAQWADEADQLASESSRRSSAYGDEYATTRTGMPAPVPIPSGGLFESVVSSIPGVTTDQERAEAAADAAHEEAAALMESYDNASYRTVQTQYFAAPPQVVLEVAPTTGPGGSGIGGSTTSYSAPTGGGAYTAPAGYSFAPGGSTSAGSVSGGTPGSPTAPAGGAPGPGPSWQYPGTAGPGPTQPSGGGTPYPVGTPPPTTVPGQYPTGGGRGRPRPNEATAPPPFVPGGPAAPGGGRPGPGYPPGGYGPGGPGGYGGRGGFGALGPGGGPGGFGPGQAQGAGFNAGLGGIGPDEAAAGRAAAGLRPGATAAGGGGLGPLGPAGGRREDDAEHRRPDYLVETEDVWGDGTRVAPPVIGDRPGR